LKQIGKRVSVFAHCNNMKKNQGQIMLFIVLIMSAVFLSITVIAGTLMINQLGQVTRIIESTQAIYAADAGIERGLFVVMRCNEDPASGNFNPIMPSNWIDQNGVYILCRGSKKESPSFGPCENSDDIPARFCNNASYKLSFPDPQSLIRATGKAGKSARAFEVQF
jgi:hypothetical protein